MLHPAIIIQSSGLLFCGGLCLVERGRSASGRTQSFVYPDLAAVSNAEGVNATAVRSSPSMCFI